MVKDSATPGASGVLKSAGRSNPWKIQTSHKNSRKPKKTAEAARDMNLAGIRPAASSSQETEFNMFVGGLHMENTSDVVVGYMRTRGITINSIEKVSAEDKPYNSFHVQLKRRDYMKVMKNKDSYWPDGIICRRYYPPRQSDGAENDPSSGSGVDEDTPSSEETGDGSPSSDVVNDAESEDTNGAPSGGDREYPSGSTSLKVTSGIDAVDQTKMALNVSAS